MTKLPDGILSSDLTRPKWDDEDKQAVRDYEYLEFEIWHVNSFGWCIPTLLISKATRGQATDRTYAVTLSGKQVRIGLGPHVTSRHTVYIRESRKDALQPFLDIRQRGAADSHGIRDRISSRRAQGQMHRAAGHSSWRWDA